MDYNEDSAVAYIRKNAATTRKYSADDVLEIIDIIWDYYEAKGLLSLDFDEDDDSADGPDIDDLVAHARKVLAKDKGKEKDAVKQLCNIYTKQAAASLKGKKFAEAVEAAGKIIDLNPENAQAYQIAGQASQLAGKNADAISYFEKYLELAPTAKNAGQIAYTVGALYQSAKNNAKAKEYYQKAVTDPKYGAEAAKLLNSLK